MESVRRRGSGDGSGPLVRPWWWALDYAYAGWRQLRSVIRRLGPESFSDGDPRLPAIVLLPGVYETWGFLEPAALRLNGAGYRVYAVPDLGANRRAVPESAQLVRRRLRELFEVHGIEQCILLAHSKGGLIGKHAMLDELLQQSQGSSAGETARIRGLVAIGTPFGGSVYARYLFSRTLRQFSPRDAVLLSLQAQENVNDRIVSIFAQFDPHIPGGSALAGATNVRLPVAGHFRTLGDPLVLAAVEEAVASLVGGKR